MLPPHGMILGLALACATIGGAYAGNLCMSDAELDTYLYAAFTRGLGVGAGTCVRKFPTMSQRGLELVRVLEETHGDEMNAYPTSYKGAFDRAFGLRAREVEDQYLWVYAGTQVYEGYGLKECNSHLEALEALSHLQSIEPAVRGYMGLAWEEARRLIPEC